MNIIEELWYGNVSPCERDFKKGSKYSELLGYIVRHEEDLQKRLNDEEKEILEKFTECTNEMYGIAEREAFVRGFVLGARIIIEVMNSIVFRIQHHTIATIDVIVTNGRYGSYFKGYIIVALYRTYRL